MIKPGDTLPDATLYESTAFGEACPVKPETVSTTAAAKGKKIVIFGLPGAYTPTCSAKHVPGYLANLDALKGKGVDVDDIDSFVEENRLNDHDAGTAAGGRLRRVDRLGFRPCQSAMAKQIEQVLGLEVVAGQRDMRRAHCRPNALFLRPVKRARESALRA